MPSTENFPPPLNGYAAATDGQQAGAGAVHADRAALTRQYDELRLQLVDLHCAAEPDMVTIDHAIDRLAQLQSHIKATRGLIGNNPIED